MLKRQDDSSYAEMAVNFRKYVGQNVRKFREDLGLTQEQLAERADFHWTYISGVERGRYNVSLDSFGPTCKRTES